MTTLKEELIKKLNESDSHKHLEKFTIEKEIIEAYRKINSNKKDNEKLKLLKMYEEGFKDAVMFCLDKKECGLDRSNNDMYIKLLQRLSPFIRDELTFGDAFEVIQVCEKKTSDIIVEKINNM